MEAEYKQEHGKDAEVVIETPSGVAISKGNNYMYGEEIEYIIYGGFDAAGTSRLPRDGFLAFASWQTPYMP